MGAVRVTSPWALGHGGCRQAADFWGGLGGGAPPAKPSCFMQGRCTVVAVVQAYSNSRMMRMIILTGGSIIPVGESSYRMSILILARPWPWALVPWSRALVPWSQALGPGPLVMGPGPLVPGYLEPILSSAPTLKLESGQCERPSQAILQKNRKRDQRD